MNRSRSYNRLIRILPLRFALIFANLVSISRGSNTKFSLEDGLLVAHDPISGLCHRAGTPKRGLYFLSVGLKRRGQILRSQYMIDRLDGTPVKVVIDVGANSGDFLLALDDNLEIYLGIEPVHSEFRALQINVSKKGMPSPVKKVVGASSGLIDFYISEIGGDSSAILPASGFTEKTKMDMETLDKIIASKEELASSEIDLLKIEAEGYEPEVLAGAKTTLSRSRFVVVDGGPERGPEEKTTIESCINFLHDLGFELSAMNLKDRPGVALFSRKRESPL